MLSGGAAKAIYHLLKLENGVLEFLDVGARELLDSLGVLDEDKCGHGVDVVFSGNILALIHINLEKKITRLVLNGIKLKNYSCLWSDF